jgi:hypothetical protein
VNQANAPRSVADEIAYLQQTAIPGIQSLITPSDSFQLVTYLQQQISTLKDMLTQLQQIGKNTKPIAGDI